jgi:hypothetical protein
VTTTNNRPATFKSPHLSLLNILTSAFNALFSSYDVLVVEDGVTYIHKSPSRHKLTLDEFEFVQDVMPLKRPIAPSVSKKQVQKPPAARKKDAFVLPFRTEKGDTTSAHFKQQDPAKFAKPVRAVFVSDAVACTGQKKFV